MWFMSRTYQCPHVCIVGGGDMFALWGFRVEEWWELGTGLPWIWNIEKLLSYQQNGIVNAQYKFKVYLM